MSAKRFDCCGNPRGGSPVTYGCIYCGNTRCIEHREQPHFCPVCPACNIRHGYPVHEWTGRKLIEIGGRR